MKYMYYYIPMVFWLIGILLLFKSVFLMIFIEISSPRTDLNIIFGTNVLYEKLPYL